MGICKDRPAEADQDAKVHESTVINPCEEHGVNTSSRRSSLGLTDLEFYYFFPRSISGGCSWRLIFFGYNPESSNLKRFSCRTSEVVGRSVAGVTDIYYYIRALTSHLRVDRQPLPGELVYHTHTHTQNKLPMKSEDFIHEILYLSPSTGGWRLEDRRKVEGLRSKFETVGLFCQLALYSVLFDCRQVTDPCMNFGG